jgi:hypothetical protein
MLPDRADHIGFVKRAATILAAPDRDLMVEIEADRPTPPVTIASADFDSWPAAVFPLL